MKIPGLTFLTIMIVGALAALMAGQEPPQDKKKTTQASVEPRKFGFTVVDASVETCCSDTPGSPTTDGRVAVSGHDLSDWRFSLSCTPEAPEADLQTINVIVEQQVLTAKHKEAWMDVAVAAFEPIGHGQAGNWMLLYDAGDGIGDWKQIARCFINGNIDKARDTFGVYVTSSTYIARSREYILNVITTGTSADGKKLENKETLTLQCTEGVQHPCVSVPPKVVWAVRNDPYIRLCDGDFNLIGTYRITSELAQ